MILEGLPGLAARRPRDREGVLCDVLEMRPGSGDSDA